MIKEQAQMLQEDFVKLSNEHGMKGSFGYFIDKADNAMLAYNKTSDNEMMHMIANLIVRIAQKHEASVDEVLKALRDGIKDLPQQN
ncbi:MAG: hypothetical protein E7522_11275 [Ruminococcaceae bacterium]|nr:hypothetical protein [Oscillospiraceae bacterium]